MANSQTGVPGIPQGPLVDRNGVPMPIWWQFFNNLWVRTGAASGTPSLVLDNISSTPGATLYRGSAIWSGLAPAARYKVLRMGVTYPEWDTLDGNSFGAQAKSSFFVSPDNASGVPAFRPIASLDLGPVAGQIPGTGTNDDATAGNTGEFISQSIPLGHAVALASGVAADIASIVLTPGDWDVWANIANIPDPTTTTSIIRAWINTVPATDPAAPNSGAYLLMQQAIGAGLAQAFPVGMKRITVPTATTTTAYMSTKMTFAVANLGAYGFLGARRPR
jgi:hypothetical protein